MNAVLYVNILQETLIPFNKAVYPDQHRFMQDNDPKHVSNHAKQYLQDNNINWWRTPPESPDLNPIENLWHELKEYLRREVKPRIKAQLICSIQEFWSTVDVRKSHKYINHLKKVISQDEVIDLNGDASGY